ncbi:MAG TPA: ABC transporter ATP-binding protein, partial [Cyanobacteria bacterium UBA11162]|nr:ABC transporter ATP-binding protein [Cyanobacteria bacterium UBA11162]
FAAEAVELKRQRSRLNRELTFVLYRLHLGYIKLATWQRTVIQTCVFSILALALLSTIQGHISLGHFMTILTVGSIAYAELEPINLLAETFARRYASMIRF